MDLALGSRSRRAGISVVIVPNWAAEAIYALPIAGLATGSNRLTQAKKGLRRVRLGESPEDAIHYISGSPRYAPIVRQQVRGLPRPVTEQLSQARQLPVVAR